MKFSFRHKLGASLLIVVWVLWGSIIVGDLLIPAHEPEVPAALKLVKTSPAPSTPAPSAPAGATGGQSGEGTVAALLASADAGDGRKIFRMCKACHTADKGGRHKVGPNLWDVVGRAKAGAGGYRFSGVLAGLGGTWTFADLDAFLARPKAFAPGTKMTFRGVKKAADRAAVILYLRSLSDSPKPLP
ncbi:MAG: cytochrome c family protein [Alphaproteobacteria bacterium]|nr:cytochrome c family protein [Alphaproteobacteria bacterium]